MPHAPGAHRRNDRGRPGPGGRSGGRTGKGPGDPAVFPYHQLGPHRQALSALPHVRPLGGPFVRGRDWRWSWQRTGILERGDAGLGRTLPPRARPWRRRYARRRHLRLRKRGARYGGILVRPRQEEHRLYEVHEALQLQPHVPRRRLVDLFQRRPRVDAFDTVASQLPRARLPERRPQVREMGLRHDVGLEARVRLGRRARQRLFRKRRAQLSPAQRSRAGRGDIRQARARRARCREERRHRTSHLLGDAQPPDLGRARLLRSRRLPGGARFCEGRQAHVHGVERGQYAAQGQVLRREGRNALHP